ncbi:MAG: hypothetical protein MH252_09915 [Thermosynechococcaceae cyanobacterium MS004]|nr:hypothetical protein [Thermosynechococcaceae cyanobacterium MS004]
MNVPELQLFSTKGRSSQWLSEAILLEERYPCPVCRHGQIEALFMVDAFSCGFCRHIFTVDGLHLRLEDNTQPFRWRWTGDRWKSAQQPISPDWLLILWALGIAFVSVPTALVWLAYHTFPPLPGQSGAEFPVLWTGLVFLSHLVIVSWLWVEQVQLPLYVTAKLYWQRLIAQVLE